MALGTPNSSFADFSVSFLDDSLKRRIEKSLQEKDQLRKALGKTISKRAEASDPYKLQILDATAGLCRDSLRMSFWGHSVWACERSPALAKALEKAYQEALSDEFYKEWLNRLTIVNGSTESFLNQTKIVFDVIVIDPMFPDEKRSALPKKDLQFVRSHAGHEDNSQELLDLALRYSLQKVLLKRPLKASRLNAQKLIHSFEGRAHRWDLYQV